MPTSVNTSSDAPATDPPASTTNPSPGAPTGSSSGRTRRIAIGAGLAVVILGGTAIALSGGSRKEEFAQRQLQAARVETETGNLASAAAALQGIVDTYGDTDAAIEARLTLAQIRLVNGQDELAVTGLRELIATDPPARFRAPAQALLGAALENATRHADAAEAYRQAADAADVDYLKANYMVQAARALVAAGQQPAAVELLRRVTTEYETTPVVTEARVRLAELTAGEM